MDDELNVIHGQSAAQMVNPHRAVAERVLELGGAVAVLTPALKVVDRLDELPNVRFAVTEINLGSCDRLTAADMRLFGSLNTIQRLLLPDSSITDEGLHAFGDWSGVTAVHLGYTQITDRGVEALAHANDLAYVELNNTQITNASCELLARIPSIQECRLGGQAINETGVSALARLPNLNRITIPFMQELLPSDLTPLASLPDLQWLDLRGDRRLDDDAVPVLAELQSLRMLMLTGASLTDAGLAELGQQLPDCNILHPSLPTPAPDLRATEWALDQGLEVQAVWPPRVLQQLPQEQFFVNRIHKNGVEAGPETGMENLSGLQSVDSIRWPGLSNADAEVESIVDFSCLRVLSLAHSDLTAAGLPQLESLQHLEELSLGGCEHVTDEAVAAVPAFPCLSRLDLTLTAITDAGLVHLK